MTSQSLSIASTSNISQARPPHLMPFRVAHTGSAPVNAYFRPRAAPSGTPGAPSVDVSPNENSVIAEENSQAKTPSIAPANLVEPLRQTATFRGRALHSLPVALPEGYTGLILQGGIAAAPSKKSKSAPRSRSRRRAADEDVGMQQNEVDGDEPQKGKALNATGRFDGITLWHPDIPADEGRDEYVRSLREWIAVAVEVHRVEDD